MSDTTTLIISVLLFLLILFGGTAWLLFNYFPKKTLSIAKDLAETVKNSLGLSPQVTINQKIIYKWANEIFELAMLEQDFDVELATSHKWLGSEKQITVRGTYRAKIGFDLQKGFSIEVNRGGLFRRGQIVLQLPRSEVLSVEPLDLQKTKTSGLINWVTNKDLETATHELGRLAHDKASKLDMLVDAEKRIEKRLNDALRPRLVKYQLEHKVKFLEATPRLPRPEKEETD